MSLKYNSCIDIDVRMRYLPCYVNLFDNEDEGARLGTRKRGVATRAQRTLWRVEIDRQKRAF